LKVDTLFYSIFQRYPRLFFQLIGKPEEDWTRYSFQSLEVKQSSFRFDGILQPLTAQELLYFVEVQFQKKPIYSRLFAEIHVYLHQYKIKNDWMAVVLFKNRNTEIPPPDHQSVEVERRVIRLYLDELGDLYEQSVGLGILKLLPLLSKQKIQMEIQKLLEQATRQKNSSLRYDQAVELIQEVLSLKFPNLEPEELAMLLGLEKELENTRYYQAILEKGEARGKEDVLRKAIPALLKAGQTPEQIAADLGVDLKVVQAFIRSQQAN